MAFKWKIQTEIYIIIRKNETIYYNTLKIKQNVPIILYRKQK